MRSGLSFEAGPQLARQFETDLIVASLCHKRKMALLGDTS